MHTIPNLPWSVAAEVYASLCELLPPPRIDTPETRARRADTAMEAVIALHPGDACEALLAAQIIGADAHAKDSLREAVEPQTQPEDVRRCRAQAVAMMRSMQSGLRMLKRDQAVREKLEAAMHPATMGRAGWWFCDASVPEAAPAEGEPPPPDAAPPAAAPAVAVAPEHAIADAELYAAMYPERAASIRAYGGLPPNIDYGPPEPELVDTLVNGTSTILRALDHITRAAVVA
jgi:hypothetical protein